MKPISFVFLSLAVAGVGSAQNAAFEADSFPVGGGELAITFIGHGTLMFTFGSLVIHVDPVSAEADYDALPKADLILVTHEHSDHLDTQAIRALTKAGTEVVANPAAAGKLAKARVLKNGESLDLFGLKIRAVPAYNTTPGRDRFHPRGRDNGYIVDFGGFTVYVAGDTENIPEFATLGRIDVAFLPMNQPYTMTPAQAAAAAEEIKPRFLYPYHFGDTDPEQLRRLLSRNPAIDVRVRMMQ